MVELVYTFDVNVTKGGTSVAPHTYALTIPSCIVEGVEVWMPAGSNGQLHWALGAAGTPVIPTNAHAYVTGNDEVIKWPLDNMIESGTWELFAYNTGTQTHLLHIRFLTRPFRTVIADACGNTFIENITIEGGVGGGGGGGGGGGTGYTFTLELPLPELDVQAGGIGSVTLLVDEVGTRPGPYNISFSAAPNGLELTAQTPTSPTALPVSATASASLGPGRYPVTVTLTNAGMTQQATLSVVVTAAGGGGGGGGGGSNASLTSNASTAAQTTSFFVYGAAWASQEQVVISLGTLQVTTTADANGNLAVMMTIPAAFPPGVYTITGSGPIHTAVGPKITVTATNTQPPPPVVLNLNSGSAQRVAIGQHFSFVWQSNIGGFYNIVGPDGTVLGQGVSTSPGHGAFDDPRLVQNKAGSYGYNGVPVNYPTNTQTIGTTVIVS